MSTYVEMPESEHALELLKFSCRLMSLSIEREAVTEVYNALTAQIAADLPALVVGLLDASAPIFQKTNPADVECVMQVMAALMVRLAPEKLPALVEKYCSTLSSSSERADLRLACLSHLFTTLPPTDHTRLTVYKALIEYSRENKLRSVSLAASFKNLDVYRSRWSLSPEEYASLQHTVCTFITNTDAVSVEKMDLALTFLESFSENETSADSEAAAAFACLQGIKLPTLFDLSKVNSVAAVQALKNSADADKRALLTLTGIFASDRLAALTAFEKANPAFYSKHGLDADALGNKMRLLTMASLAFENAKWDYASLAKELACEKADVEMWAIRALSAGLVDVKLNQVDEEALISASTRKVSFSDQSWGQLQERLNRWRDDLEGLLRIVDSFKPQPKQQQQGAAYDPEEEGHNVQPNMYEA